MTRQSFSVRISFAILLIALPAVLAANAANTIRPDDPPSFGQLLNELRSGQPIDTDVLAAAAESAARDGRADAPRIAAFYQNLSTAELRRGFAANARYGEAFERLRAADQNDLEGAEWIAERTAIEAELSQLVESEGDAADLLPVGLALGSLASLEVARAIAAGPDSEERLLWLTVAEDYAREALERFDRIGVWKPQLEPLLARGRIQRARLAYTDAEATLETCAHRAKQVGRPDYARLALKELLGVANDHDDIFLRVRLLRRVAQLAPPGGFRPLIETTAEHLIDERQPSAALALLQRHPLPAGADDETRDRHALLEGNALLRLGRIREASESYALITANSALRSIAGRSTLRTGRRSRPAAAIEALAARRTKWSSTSSPERSPTRHCGEAELARGQPDRAVLHLERALAAADEVDERRVRDLVGPRTTRARSSASGSACTRSHSWPRPACRARVSHSLRCASSRSHRRAVCARGAPANGASAAWPASTFRGWVRPTTGLLEWAGRYELGLVSWVMGADFGVVVWLASEWERPMPKRIPIKPRVPSIVRADASSKP